LDQVRRELRVEAALGRREPRPHWAYDLNRHLRLADDLKKAEAAS
jgi:hypothetical protein